MTAISSGLFHAAAMLWQMLWALVLGFTVSALLQVFVSKKRMVHFLGRNGWREVLLALSFGTASSSCSYAAAATTKTMFRKGAAFLPAMIFMVASTNLVMELSIILWLLLGWQFLLGEVVASLIMTGVLWAIVSVHPPKRLIEAARRHRGRKSTVQHHHGLSDGKPKAVRVGGAFVMDITMLWKEIVGGVLIAGFLMTLVPKAWWQAMFLSTGPAPLRLIEGVLVSPLVAMACFVCSVGNIPLASLLWSNVANFGGVIAFRCGDLIVLPLVVAYAKYYGWKMALYLSAILYAAMVVAGLAAEVLFLTMHLVPGGDRGAPAIAQAGFHLNYTTWLNLAALAGASGLFFLHFRHRSHEEQHGKQDDHAHHLAHAQHHH